MLTITFFLDSSDFTKAQLSLQLSQRVGGPYFFFE